MNRYCVFDKHARVDQRLYEYYEHLQERLHMLEDIWAGPFEYVNEDGVTVEYF